MKNPKAIASAAYTAWSATMLWAGWSGNLHTPKEGMFIPGMDASARPSPAIMTERAKPSLPKAGQ